MRFAVFARNQSRLPLALLRMAAIAAALAAAPLALAAEPQPASTALEEPDAVEVESADPLAPQPLETAPAEPAGSLEAAVAEGGQAAEPAADHGDHADHYDLSHGDASPMMDNPIELRYDMALASFLIFLSLLTLLGWFAWRPIMEGLDKRENAIALRIADAQRSADEAAEQLRLYQARLAAAADEAQALIVQARRNAESVAEKIRDEAREDARRERVRAEADIQAAKLAALRDVSQRSAQMAVQLAGRILHRELRPDDHAALIGEALEHFPSRN